MPNLAGFTAFARKVGVVPLVPQAPEAWGTERGTENIVTLQSLREPVPRVPPVPLQNDVAWDEEDWQAAFDERAGILEYDGGWPRPEAERLAREEIDARRAASL